MNASLTRPTRAAFEVEKDLGGWGSIANKSSMPSRSLANKVQKMEQKSKNKDEEGNIRKLMIIQKTDVIADLVFSKVLAVDSTEGKTASKDQRKKTVG